MNDLALQILYSGPLSNNKEVALELARTNVAFFPASFNIYDTYEEILAAAGQRDLAIKMYRKSIEMNPKNEGGKSALSSDCQRRSPEVERCAAQFTTLSAYRW